MPTKEFSDAWLRTLTWARAIKDSKRQPDAKPIKQVTYLNKLDRGLSLVLVYSAGGTKRFRVLTYKNGQPHTVKLGTYPTMGLKEAKAKAQAYYNDPAKYEDEAAEDTFKKIGEEWFKRRVEKRGLRSAYYLRRHLEVHIYPKWATRKFREIRRSEVTTLLDYIADHHGQHQADAVLATLRSIMVWFQSRNENYTTPIVQGMKRSEASSRERILTDGEIRQLWSVTGGYPFGALVRMLLLTAQRRTKVATMKWDDISEGVWIIRAEPREKGNAGSIKLSDMALDIINSQPRLFGNPHVFAGRRCAPITGFSKPKIELDKKLDMPSWVLHDLRRTARSLLSRVGVKPHIAERTLGHAIPGVAGIYDRHAYFDEIGDALAQLAGQIERIVHPPADNIVHLRG